METDLFGNEIIKEENFEIIYKGSSFVDGKILIGLLHSELKSLEELIQDSVNLLIQTGKIGYESKNYEIFIKIEKGSIAQKIKVVFRKKTTIAIVGTFLIPFLNTTYQHFLDKSGRVLGEFEQEVKIVQNDKKFKKNLSNLLSPLNNNDDNLIVNNGNINLNIGFRDKESICNGLKSENAEEYKKDGIFTEELIGVIRKLDLDAAHNNYFGFNIKNGQSRVPTTIKGEFNPLDIKDILDTQMKIKANAKYKDNVITHIEIIKFEILEKNQKQEKINF